MRRSWMLLRAALSLLLCSPSGGAASGLSVPAPFRLSRTLVSSYLPADLRVATS